MASRTFSGDLQLHGRGRQGREDSSSSRESSPSLRKRKRSFSLGSGDGDPDIPPIADDDTPPPPERPLIRQAVAFGSATSLALNPSNIYQATLPDTTSDIVFLPGQAPVAPKKSAPKRKKKNDAYKSQSGRFRLETYDAKPSEAPPIQHGVGLYASTFRGYQDRRLDRSESPAILSQPPRHPSTSASTLHSDRSASPGPLLRVEPGLSKNRTARSRNKSGMHNRASGSETPSQFRISSTSRLPTPMADYGTSPTSSSSSTTRHNHYRLDYDTGRKLEPPAGNPGVPTLPTLQMLDTRGAHAFLSPADHSNVSSSSSEQPGHPPSEGTPQSRKHGAKMVTIYAQDIRSGVVDNQLIEVQVPIRPADDPSEGYWADAKELIEQWQKGPARVDGPARVYTMRGKYRQILLRVSATNVDDFASANVVLKRNISVEVVVENLPAPGVPPPPPQLPSTLAGFNHQPIIPGAESTYQGIISSPKNRQPNGSSSADSISNARHIDDDYDGDHDREEPVRPAPRIISSPSETVPPVETNSQIQARARLKLQKKPYDSPCSDDEPEKVQESIRKAVDHLIQRDDKEKWKGFFKLKGRLETASNMVAIYRFVQDLFDKYVGQPVPFRSRRDLIIEEKHIIAALTIEDSDGRFASNCRETLDLLKLYGKDGERDEDRAVLELMAEVDVAYNANPLKRLLHLLRDVDQKWLAAD